MTVRQESAPSTVMVAPRFPTARVGWERKVRDTVANRLMALAGFAIVAVLVVIGVSLLARTWPILQAYSPLDLLLGQRWQPMAGRFGFAPFIVGSLAVTGTAMLFAVVPAVLTGIYMAEYVSLRTRRILKPVLDLLVGIPSVVYGLWGVLFVVPLVRDHVGPWLDATLGQSVPLLARTNPSGYGLLTAGAVLAIMSFPLIVAVTEEVLRTVSQELRAAVLALGATRWEATKVVVLRRGLPGILAAVVLGFSRAFGETLAVMMVVGNVAKLPTSLFDPAYPLPALIANNYGEMMSVPLYESALMGAALLLFTVVLLFNLAARTVIVRMARGQ